MRSLHPRAYSRFDDKVEKGGEGFNGLFAWLLIGLVCYGIFGEDAKANPMLERLVMAESGGNPEAVSSHGARGLVQVMPKTARHPGYGIIPLRNRSRKEQLRFANDYLNVMEHKYHGSQVLAAAAYNAGPNTVDKALVRVGGNIDRAIALLPEETQEYVKKVALYQPPFDVAALDKLMQ